MKKTSLLFIYGPLGGGGAERVLLEFLKNLDREKYEIDLCLMVNKGILLPEVPEDIQIIPLWESYSAEYKIAYRISKYFKNNSLFRRKLQKKLKKKYDVSISFLEGMPLKLHALMKGDSKKMSWVHIDLFTFPYTNKQFYSGEQKEAYGEMDRIICVSGDTHEMFVKRFPIFSHKTDILYNPVDLENIHALAKMQETAETNKTRLVSVGRLTRQKRPDRLINVFISLIEEGYDVDLLLVGDGELRESLEKQVERLRVKERVTFTGFVRNPYPHIRNADLMVLASDSEGFGLVIVEAMALGVPVVSTKTAGPMEIIGKDEYGLLCEKDETSLLEAVKKMINNKELREKYAEAGKKRAEDFSVEKALIAFEKLVDEVLEK